MLEFDPEAVEPIPTAATSTYTKLAEAYGREYYASVAEAAADELGDRQVRVLDAGTGPGILPVALARRTSGVRIEAFDYTRRLVEISRNRAERHGLTSRISVLTADIYNLPIAAGSYPFITCTGVLHGLHDPAVALTELYRVLSPGGTVWAFDPAVLELDESVDTLLDSHEQEVLAAYQAADGPSSFEPKEAEQLVNATPFEHRTITEGPDGDSRLYLHKPRRQGDT